MSDHLAGAKENSCVLIDGGAPGVNQLVSCIWLAVVLWLTQADLRQVWWHYNRHGKPP